MPCLYETDADKMFAALDSVLLSARDVLGWVLAKSTTMHEDLDIPDDSSPAQKRD